MPSSPATSLLINPLCITSRTYRNLKGCLTFETPSFQIFFMKYLFIALLAISGILSACHDRNRVGTQGNTGDGGVQSTSTKDLDTSAAATARDKKNDTTGLSDTVRNHRH